MKLIHCQLEDIALGFCQCGCGMRTNIATRTVTRNGYIKGQPIRFIRNHRKKLDHLVRFTIAESGCWLWIGPLNNKGYGTFNRKYAHRVFYEQYKGPIPNDLELDHLCRNTACVNPDHLEPVTHAINLRRSKNAKLTDAEVLEIRKLAEDGLSSSQIASRYRINPSYAWRIMSGERR